MELGGAKLITIIKTCEVIKQISKIYVSSYLFVFPLKTILTAEKLIKYNSQCVFLIDFMWYVSI